MWGERARTCASAPIVAGYRPALDGLRALAVYLVVLFHAGVTQLSGGFIGVDVFFVLSGYLVTQLLLRDFEAVGHVRFVRFFARRYRRLLPASFVTLVVTAAVYTAIASPAELASAIDGFKAAFLYVANWFFIGRSADYFAADIDANPVVHFWSLAVEEQFYLLWPIALAGLFLLTRGLGARARRSRQVIVLVAALGGLLWTVRLADVDLNRAYYGTDARAYQLLAGAFLALTPGIIAVVRRRRIAPGLGVVALAAGLLLATSVIDLDAVDRGIAITAATIVLIVAVEAATRGPVNAMLSIPPVTYLGRISYGTYLWHWPVIIVIGALIEISPLSTFLVAAFVATGLASLSFTLLERPIRERGFLDRVDPLVIGAGLALSLLGALVIVPRIIDPFGTDGSQVRPEVAATAPGTPVPDIDFAGVRVDYRGLEGVSHRSNCLDAPSEECVRVQGRGPHVLVIGDSHSQSLYPGMVRMAQTEDLTLSWVTSAGCPWQRNLFMRVRAKAPEDGRLREECVAVKADFYDRVLGELEPDVVIAVTNDYLTRRPGEVVDENGNVQRADGDALRDQIEDETTQSLAALHESAQQVVIVEPIPTDPDKDPFACLTESEVLEACRFVAVPGPTPIEQVYRDTADNERTFSVDIDRLACPFLPICDPVVGDDVVRFDNQHLAPQFALGLGDELATILRDNGLIPS